MSFDIYGARQAGYSDAEIAGFLASDKSTKFDVAGALQAGYSPGEIVDELAKHPAYTAGKQELEDAAHSPKANDFSSRMSRDDYQRQFLATNPQASGDALKAVMAQYDDAQQARAQAGGNAVQSKFDQLQSPEAMFNARLNDRLQGKRNGIVPQLPGRIQPDQLQDMSTPTQPSTLDTVAGNLVGGALNTSMGALSAGAHLIGANDFANEMDTGRAQVQARQKELGGDTFTGKVSNLVGGIVPAMGAPEGLLEQAAVNTGLFALPAFQDTLKAKLAEGYSRPLALVHAAEAFGVNLVAPTVMQHGAGAIIGKLGMLDAAGVKGAALGMSQAASEGAAFSAANSVMDKGTDVLAGQRNDRPWIDPEDMAINATGFGAMRAGHMAAGVAGAALGREQAAQRQQQLLTEIGKAATVDDAIAAASAAVSAPTGGPDVADIMLGMRPLENPASWQTAMAAPDAGAQAEIGQRYVRVTNEDGTTGFVPGNDGIPGVPVEGEPAQIGAAYERVTNPDGSTGFALAPDREQAANAWRRANDPTIPTLTDNVDHLRTDIPTLTDTLSQPTGDGWYTFPRETGTLGIPREQMPQIRAEHRGAMVNFLNARGIPHEQVEVAPESLKPTQAEFSIDKVQQAHDHEGGDRSILISGDGHVLDGHHQWAAALEKGEPVKAIRLDAPIRKLLDTVREFPSAETAEGAPQNEPQNIPEKIPDAGAAPKVDTSAGFKVGEKWINKDGTGSYTIESVSHDGKLGRALFPGESKTYAVHFDAETENGWRPEGKPAAPQNHLEAARAKHARQDEAVAQAAANIAARKASAAQRMRERVKAADPFLHFLADHGVSPADRADIGLEAGNKGARMVPGFGPVLRKSGKRLDELALLARDAGFLTQHDIDSSTDTGGTRKLADMIRRAVAGKEVIGHPADVEQRAPGADERLAAEARRLGIDTEGKSADQLYDEVAAAHAVHEDRREITGADTVTEQHEIERHADQFTPEEAAAVTDLDADIPLDGGKPSDNLTDEDIDAIFGIRKTEGARAGGREAEGATAAPAREGDQGTAAAREGTGERLNQSGKRQPLVMDEESYLAQNGASKFDYGESALHMSSSNVSGAHKKRSIEAQSKKDSDLSARRAALREEYAAKVAAGEIRPPSIKEQTIERANGHPDLESTQAARRIAEKRGWDWRQDGKADEASTIDAERAKIEEKRKPKPAPLAEGIPRAFLKKTKVDHQVYIEDEGRWETVKVPADKALKSLREDIDNLEAMLNCMKG